MNRIPIWAWFIIPTIILVVAGAILLTKTPQQPENQPESQTQSTSESKSKAEEVSVQIEGVQEFPIASRTHIDQGKTASDYNSNPPTSGQHWPGPAAKGIYEKSLSDEQIVHNLEHGFVWISYKPDTPSETIQALKDIVNEDDWKLILEPREKNESQISTVAWGRLLNMDQVDASKIKEFIKAYRNRGPERTPQ